MHRTYREISVESWTRFPTKKNMEEFRETVLLPLVGMYHVQLNLNNVLGWTSGALMSLAKGVPKDRVTVLARDLSLVREMNEYLEDR